MFAAHRPKLVILTIDFWWFNSARSEEVVDLQPDTVGPLTLVQLAQPFQWIAQGKIGVGDFIASALAPGFNPAGIGADAKCTSTATSSGRWSASWRPTSTTSSTSARRSIPRTGRSLWTS